MAIGRVLSACLTEVPFELYGDGSQRREFTYVTDAVNATIAAAACPTLGYRFFIRDGALHMHTAMRSQDLWLGLPYDIFTATLLQELIAGWLGVQLGEYHHIDSLHLYDRDFTCAAQIGQPAPSAPMPPVAVDWTEFDDLLSSVLADQPFPGASATWAQWGRILASYRAWSVGERDTARSIAAVIPGDMAAALQRWYDHLTNRPALAGAGDRAVTSR